MKQKKFLTAEWRKLIMANYIIPPETLVSYLPANTEVDLWNGQCYVSLVGFMFQQVRVKGMKIPFHTNFPEVNLRFYVRYKENDRWKRGVVFIKEIVSKPAITFIANRFFNERYVTMPMRYSWIKEGDHLNIAYRWKKKNEWNKLQIKADAEPKVLTANSEEEFITEHFWGYSSISKDKTVEYHVDHPRWDIYTVKEFSIDCDFAGLYGDIFKNLTNRNPDSVFLAEGSAIAVFQKRIL
ncbi:MAG: DUF2071 domain-containing protein [Bacteroidia bacterium]|nr:DUF2071 domain-containing protein [Bacteroidia bacterium]